jgi:DNA primase catalytic subunit
MSEEVTGSDAAQNTETPEVAEEQRKTTESVEDLPEFAQKMISKLRDEAKRNRLKGKEDTENALSAAKQDHASAIETLTAERDAIAAERDSIRSDVTRMRAALNAGIKPELVDEFASRLKGESDEEINEDAQRLAEIFNTTGKPERKSDPSQGKHAPLNGDPILQMLSSKLGI